MNSLYQNIDRMEERKANIYSKKHGERNSQLLWVLVSLIDKVCYHRIKYWDSNPVYTKTWFLSNFNSIWKIK